MTEKFYNVVIILLSVVISIIVVELCLRVFGIVDKYVVLNTPIGQSHFILYQYKEPDRDIGWFSKITSTPFIKDPVVIDDQLVSSSSKNKKIFFIGDSGTFGVGVSRKETFVNLISEDILKKNNSLKAQFINAGVIGATPPDTLWLFEKYLAPLKPNVVIYTIFLANDINQSLRDFDFEKFNYNQKLSSLALYKLIYVNWLKYKLHFKKIDEYIIGPWEDLVDENSLNIMDFYEGEVASYQRPSTKKYQEAQEKFFSILSQIKKKCEDNGIEFAVAMIPTRSFIMNQLDIQPIDFDLIERLKNKNIWHHLNLDFTKSRNDVVNFLKNNGFIFADPSMALKEELGEKTFNKNDDHLSPDGHKILSRHLLRIHHLWK